MLRLFISITLLAVPMAKIPQLTCGESGHDSHLGGSCELDGGPVYIATINGVGNSTDNVFTVTANIAAKPSNIGCAPSDLLFIFVGNGKGSHRPQEHFWPSKEDTKKNVVFKVHGPESSFDWQIISQEGSGCDYLVSIHDYRIDCATPAASKYQCYQGQCKPAATGVDKSTCDSICH
jgi:hypothetical protein